MDVPHWIEAGIAIATFACGAVSVYVTLLVNQKLSSFMVTLQDKFVPLETYTKRIEHAENRIAMLEQRRESAR